MNFLYNLLCDYRGIMHLIYIDESGDSGIITGKKKIGTEFYTLSALIIKESYWLTTLNSFIEFRRFLKDEYKIPMMSELKATDFINNSGPFSTLGYTDKMRMNLYKMALKKLSRLEGIKTWAILFKKREWEKKYPKLDIFQTSWQNMIERIERFTTKLDERCIVFPDEGRDEKIRSIMRQLRRFSRPQAHYKKTTLKCNAELVLEDPNIRESHNSYIIQFTDYIAYAASRAVYQKPLCGEKYWDYLGDIRDDSVNAISRKTERKDLKFGIAIKP